jgi:hypothetical protein
MIKRYCMHGEWFTRGEMIERRNELKRMIANLERDLEIARRAVPDLEAARKVARDVAAISKLEFLLALAQAEYGEHVREDEAAR